MIAHWLHEVHMNGSLRIRLSAMMFLEYFIWGAWAVCLATFLTASPYQGGLNLPSGDVALIYATTAIGAMISPIFIGLFADRLFSTQKVLGWLHLAGAVLLACAAYSASKSLSNTWIVFTDAASVEKVGDGTLIQALAKQELVQSEIIHIAGSPPASWIGDLFGRPADKQARLDELNKQNADLQEIINPAVASVNKSEAVQAAASKANRPFFWLMMAYALCYMPTLMLTNSISFRNMSDPDKYFGGIRVLGTIGWIIAGWVVGFGMNSISTQPIYLAAAASAVLGLFCFALPHTPPSRESKSLGETLGLPALAMLKDWSFLVFFVCCFLITIPLAFYYLWTNPFLVEIHAPNPTALQTLGQISEIFFMLLLPVCLLKFGTKWMLLFGMLAWCLRYAMFAWQNMFGVIAIGLPLHGICYDFFFVVAFLYVDRQAPKQLRASAQGLITFITLGVGTFIGDWFSGVVKDWFPVGNTVDYGKFWLVPLAIAAVVTVLFFLLFRERPVAAGEASTTKRLEGVQAEPVR
jgi:nucleoside transporter